jgi:hypothetical protein
MDDYGLFSINGKPHISEICNKHQSTEKKDLECLIIFGVLFSYDIRCADHVTPSIRKSRHYFADSGGHSVGIVRLRTKATEFSLVIFL